MQDRDKSCNRHFYILSSGLNSIPRWCGAAHHNGNLIADSGKGMTAEYNHLNLPREVTVQSNNGIDPGGIIQWTYDATGRKLKKVSPDGIIWLAYERKNADAGLHFHTGEGLLS